MIEYDLQVRAAFALAASQAHRSLEHAFGGSPINEPDPELRAARCIAYLVGRAVDRNLLAPVWDCPARYRGTFEIPTISLVLDASNLDGHPLSWEDLGGLEKCLALLGFLADRLESMPVLSFP